MAAFDDSSVLAFEEAGHQYALCSERNVNNLAGFSAAPKFDSKGGRWKKVPPPPATDAEYFRRRLQRVSTAELRQFLTRGGFPCPANDSAHMFSRIAELVHGGRFELFERVGGSAAIPGVSTGGSAPHAAQEYAPPPASVCPVDLVVNKPPKPVGLKPATGLDSQAQARVLIQAAQRGVPFCELCLRT